MKGTRRHRAGSVSRVSFPSVGLPGENLGLTLKSVMKRDGKLEAGVLHIVTEKVGGLEQH